MRPTFLRQFFRRRIPATDGPFSRGFSGLEDRRSGSFRFRLLEIHALRGARSKAVVPNLISLVPHLSVSGNLTPSPYARDMSFFRLRYVFEIPTVGSFNFVPVAERFSVSH